MSSVLTSLKSISAMVAELSNLLADYIGTFSNGLKAIWVEPPYIPPQLSCTGLQVVIGRIPEDLQPQKPCIGSQQAIQRKFWRVTLVQFDLSDEGIDKLDGAIAAIQRRFPSNRMRSPETTEDSYPQVSFLLDFSSVVNLSL